MRFQHLSPALAAVLGDLLVGAGLLMLFRHRASLGGVNVVALYLQERLGWRAGRVQLVVDLLILLAALASLICGACCFRCWARVGADMTLAINHRPGRYMAV